MPHGYYLFSNRPSGRFVVPSGNTVDSILHGICCRLLGYYQRCAGVPDDSRPDLLLAARITSTRISLYSRCDLNTQGDPILVLYPENFRDCLDADTLPDYTVHGPLSCHRARLGRYMAQLQAIAATPGHNCGQESHVASPTAVSVMMLACRL